MQGARSAETGMYMEVHEDFEHRATPQTPSAAIFKTASKSRSTTIAAHSRSEGLTIVTNNAKEFSKVPALQIENWVG